MPMHAISLSDREFNRIQAFIFDEAGITLAPTKKTLVSGRLERRLRHHGLASYTDYLALLDAHRCPQEHQLAIDLLTTNETYFFREPRHFELLADVAREATLARRPLRVWSAASSSGEEAYSIAMVLADTQGALPWEILGSDISQRMLAKARAGHYPEERTRHVPTDYRRRWCLRGTGAQAGTVLVERGLRARVRFESVNLNQALPAQGLGLFDFIFLRNVLIYFTGDTKREVVGRLIPQLAPGGRLLVGHSETLNDLGLPLRAESPSVYRRI